MLVTRSLSSILPTLVEALIGLLSPQEMHLYQFLHTGVCVITGSWSRLNHPRPLCRVSRAFSRCVSRANVGLGPARARTSLIAYLRLPLDADVRACFSGYLKQSKV